MTNQIAVFSRVPNRFSVKRRLARSIGEDNALEFYLETLARTIRVAKPLGAELWIDGVIDDVGWMQGLEWHHQVDGDLGTRMYDALTHGCKVLIGCDVPSVTTEYLSDALTRLQSCDIVIGPVEDGGYCLIGMNDPQRTVFENISWGTGQVLQQTLAKTRSLDLKTELLDVLWDVDEIQDYERWLSGNTNAVHSQ